MFNKSTFAVLTVVLATAWSAYSSEAQAANSSGWYTYLSHSQTTGGQWRLYGPYASEYQAYTVFNRLGAPYGWKMFGRPFYYSAPSQPSTGTGSSGYNENAQQHGSATTAPQQKLYRVDIYRVTYYGLMYYTSETKPYTAALQLISDYRNYGAGTFVVRGPYPVN